MGEQQENSGHCGTRVLVENRVSVADSAGLKEQFYRVTKRLSVEIK